MERNEKKSWYPVAGHENCLNCNGRGYIIRWDKQEKYKFHAGMEPRQIGHERSNPAVEDCPGPGVRIPK